MIVRSSPLVAQTARRSAFQPRPVWARAAPAATAAWQDRVTVVAAQVGRRVPLVRVNLGWQAWRHDPSAEESRRRQRTYISGRVLGAPPAVRVNRAAPTWAWRAAGAPADAWRSRVTIVSTPTTRVGSSLRVPTWQPFRHDPSAEELRRRQRSTFRPATVVPRPWGRVTVHAGFQSWRHDPTAEESRRRDRVSIIGALSISAPGGHALPWLVWARQPVVAAVRWQSRVVALRTPGTQRVHPRQTPGWTAFRHDPSAEEPRRRNRVSVTRPMPAGLPVTRRLVVAPTWAWRAAGAPADAWINRIVVVSTPAGRVVHPRQTPVWQAFRHDPSAEEPRRRNRAHVARLALPPRAALRAPGQPWPCSRRAGAAAPDRWQARTTTPRARPSDTRTLRRHGHRPVWARNSLIVATPFDGRAHAREHTRASASEQARAHAREHTRAATIEQSRAAAREHARS